MLVELTRLRLLVYTKVGVCYWLVELTTVGPSYRNTQRPTTFEKMIIGWQKERIPTHHSIGVLDQTYLPPNTLVFDSCRWRLGCYSTLVLHQWKLGRLFSDSRIGKLVVYYQSMNEGTVLMGLYLLFWILLVCIEHCVILSWSVSWISRYERCWSTAQLQRIVLIVICYYNPKITQVKEMQALTHL